MRILILTSSTGGGHDMRARAFAAWAARSTEGPVETRILKTLEQAGGIHAFGVMVYNWIQRTAPFLHHIYFNFLELVQPCGGAARLLGARAFRETLDEFKPDIILSVHGSLNHGFFDVAWIHMGEQNIRCVIYCGELHGGYGFSRNWVNPRADLFIGAVEDTVEAARQLGMASTRVLPGGFVLDPSFYEPPQDLAWRENYIRETLQLDPDRFILVLSTGAVGANNHLAFVQSLENAKVEVQVLAICGMNEQTRASLEAWSKTARFVRLSLLGYCREMSRIMQCASAIVARPGTGTTSEAILRGCPLIHNGIGGIMPQEWITVKYCRVHNIAPLLHTAWSLPGIIKDWMQNPDHLAETRARMESLRPKSHPLDILRRLRHLLPRPVDKEIAG